MSTTTPKPPHRARRWSELLVPAIRRRKADPAGAVRERPALLAVPNKPRSSPSKKLTV